MKTLTITYYLSQLVTLVGCFLFLTGVIFELTSAQEDNNEEASSSSQGLNLLGTCEDIPDPCVEGERYGDPGDCTVYYECVVSSNGLQLFHCPDGERFHYKKFKCRSGDKMKCAPPCDERGANKKKAALLPVEPVKTSIIPEKVTTNRNVPTETNTNQNVTNELQTEGKVDITETLTEANEPLTTKEDKTGIHAEGKLTKVNDTTSSVNPSTAVTDDDPSNATSITGLVEVPTEVDEIITTTKSTTTTTTTSTTTTITTPTTTSTVSPTKLPSIKTTKSATQSSSEPGIIVDTEDDDGGYVIITSPSDTTEALGGSTGESGGISTATIGAAAGIIGAILIAAIIIALVICYFRKRKKSKMNEVVSVENPKYRKGNGDQKHAYRFSRDASLLVNEKPANNNSTEKLAFVPGRKRPAPGAPGKDKRKAPAPPNPFTGEVEDDSYVPPLRRDSSDLYERDTDGSGEDDIEMKTFTSTFGTGTGTFGRGPGFNDPLLSKVDRETANGRLQNSRSTDYSSSDDSDGENEQKGRKYQSGDIDDAVFKDELTAKDVNNSMDAYLSAYDQALNPFGDNN